MKIRFFCSIEHTNTEEIDNTKIVIDSEKIFIHFQYPITREVIIMFESVDGFTKRDVFNSIKQGYRHIYKKENSEFYGVWGYALDDLYLEGCTYKCGALKLSVLN
jgi:hypothetical protein